MNINQENILFELLLERNHIIVNLNSALENLKAQIAEKDSIIAELTKKEVENKKEERG